MRRSVITTIVILLVIGLLLPLGFSGKSSEDGEQEAIQAAKAWLTTVDQQRYGESWDESATYFQRAVPRTTWMEQLDAVRRPLGDVKERELIGAKRTKSLPGAPDGDYVVIQFSTSFENKASAVETITPMMDGDRGWRVSGYYIK